MDFEVVCVWVSLKWLQYPVQKQIMTNSFEIAFRWAKRSSIIKEMIEVI